MNTIIALELANIHADKDRQVCVCHHLMSLAVELDTSVLWLFVNYLVPVFTTVTHQCVLP